MTPAVKSAISLYPAEDWLVFGPIFHPRPPLNIWQWAEREVDFSLAPNYDTPFHGPYDPEFMPYWKEPVECITNNGVREIVCLKPTRAGGSENIFLNVIRFCIANRPQPIMYLTGDQLTAERFMEKRVKRGMKCAKETAKAWRHAQGTQHDIAFLNMDFRVAWPKSKQTFKQDGWAMVLFDELSMAPDGSQEQARRRVDSYPFPHIVWLSSMDPTNGRPSDEDPIVIEYEDSDRCVWMMPDPETGKDFIFEHAGIRWDENAKTNDEWDLKQVDATAHYITPEGTRIEERDRLKVARSGRWVSTNPKGTPKKRGFKVVAPMIPFASCGFGALAKEFLTAKERGSVALKSYFYERWCEKFYEKKITANASILEDRMGAYGYKEKFYEADTVPGFPGKPFYVGKTATRIMTIDVQKEHVWYVVRDWINSDSGLVKYDRVGRWEQIEQEANELNVGPIFVDNSYADRQPEVFQMAAKLKMFPIYGRDIKGIPFIASTKDPETGDKSSPETQILTYTFNPDVFKPIFFDLLTGKGKNKWYVYRGIEREYCSQVVAEECIDGVWKPRKGFTRNHLFDCEVYQVLAANIMGLLRF